MVLIVLLTHFLYGGCFHLVLNKAIESIAEYRHKSNWLYSGYIHHADYRFSKNRLVLACTVFVVYIIMYLVIIVGSFQVLLFNS